MVLRSSTFPRLSEHPRVPTARSENRINSKEMPSPHPPLPRRIVLKIKRIVREMNPAERTWAHAWPLIDSVPGLLYGMEERWLFDAAWSLPRSANMVEVGSFKGRSTCCLAFGCTGTNKHVYAVDTFDGNSWDFAERGFLEDFRQNVSRCGLSRYVTPLVGSSNEVGKEWNKPIDLLFIDGSHRYEDVLSDFYAFFPHVAEGGIVAFHDVSEHWPEVLKAWHEVIKGQLSEVGYFNFIGFGRKPGAKRNSR